MEPMRKVQGQQAWREAPEAIASSKAVLPGARRWELWYPGKVWDCVRLGLSSA